MIILKSEREIAAYFDNKVRLGSSLQSQGYKSQAELALHGDEIGVAIGRDGELLKYFHGHHRLALAKQLGLDNVTITVGMVHHEWVKRCCDKYPGNPMTAIRKGLADLAVQG